MELPTGGDYTFVVKSTYTIFTKNASSGLVINARTIDNNVDNMVGDSNQDDNSTDDTNNDDTNNPSDTEELN